jgi:calcium-dependent protein kinase
VSKQPNIKKSASTIRGNLVRTYQSNVEDDFYLDREHELGKGGCGVVVGGEHKETRAQYAIKIVNKASAERGRLDRELKLMKDVDHANIVRLFSVYDGPTHMYFVMELCLGGHLGNLLSRQPNKCVDEEWAKKLGRQLLSAVAHIHGRGIAHRDIKLQNILIDSTCDRNAQLKLIDFGYGSRYIGALPMRTKCGTPYTTAPEVIRECYDERCDVWSVGVVLYIMLSGKRPFEAIDIGGGLSDAGKAAMIANILAGRYHFNHKQWNQVSKQGINFVKALLTHDYRHRMRSHEALESPWLKEIVNHRDYQAHLTMRNEHIAKAVTTLKHSTEATEFQRTGMVALVFGIPSRVSANLRSVFQAFDFDASGTLSKEEFRRALAKLAPELTVDDVDRLFDIVDIDKNQQISYTEFLVATMDPREVDIEEFNKAFRLLDEDGNGYITKDELRKVVKQMLQQAMENSNKNPSDFIQLHHHMDSNTGTGDYLDDEAEQRVNNIFNQVDLNNDGSISYAEFIRAMTGLDPKSMQKAQLQKGKSSNSTLSLSSSNSPIKPSLKKLKENSKEMFHSEKFSSHKLYDVNPEELLKNRANSMKNIISPSPSKENSKSNTTTSSRDLNNNISSNNSNSNSNLNNSQQQTVSSGGGINRMAASKRASRMYSSKVLLADTIVEEDQNGSSSHKNNIQKQNSIMLEDPYGSKYYEEDIAANRPVYKGVLGMNHNPHESLYQVNMLFCFRIVDHTYY